MLETESILTVPWTQSEAVELCQSIERLCPDAGCHVALTGGLLYKHGPRKDCDLIFYRIRQTPNIDSDKLFKRLMALGITDIRGFGWCYKASFKGKSLDLFFPEERLLVATEFIPGHTNNNVHTY